MDNFNYQIIEDAAKELYIRALKFLPPDVEKALKKAKKRETNSTAKDILQTMIRNVELASKEEMLICQDTGLPVFLITIGSQFMLDGAKIRAAVTEGAKRATVEHPFRGSSTHPLSRVNPQNSVGEGLPVIYWDFKEDQDFLDILMIPKGSGSENMSRVEFFTPGDGIDALKKFVVDSVFRAGANPCPPTVVGVGIGGTADLVGVLAKKAIVRPVGKHHHDKEIKRIEKELLAAINSLGIGPMGLGGDTTSLAVHIETAYTHITLNPIAINMQCWPARRARGRIYKNGAVEYGF